MSNRIVARGIVFFNFSSTADLGGLRFPQECILHYSNPVPVYFYNESGENDKNIGNAQVARVGNSLVADIYIDCSLDPDLENLFDSDQVDNTLDPDQVEDLIRQMYPSAYIVPDPSTTVGNMVFSGSLEELKLSFQKNVDPKIRNLSNRMNILRLSC